MSQYCQPSDLITVGLPSTAIPSWITTPMQTNACIVASARADAYIRPRYPLPITGSVAGGSGNFDPSLVLNTAYIAAYIIMTMRGFMPNAGADKLIVDNYYAAIGNPNIPGSVAESFFGRVERGSVHLDVLVNAPTPPLYALPAVYTKPPRGI